MGTPHCTKRNFLAVCLVSLVLTFITLHFKEHGFKKPSATTIISTLSGGFNNTKSYISKKYEEFKIKSLDTRIASVERKIDHLMEVDKRLPFANQNNMRDNDREVSQRELDKVELNWEGIEPLPPPNPSTMNDKWIIITYNCANFTKVKQLAGVPGWKLLIAQEGTPHEDFKSPSVVVLSQKQQYNYSFSVPQFINQRADLLKNTAYLYAIQHGAKYIYDAEVDSNASTISSLDEMKEEKYYLTYDGKQRFYNGLVHFGQDKLWPRGYPLDLINDIPIREYKSCKNVRPLVQYGVSKGDPDLDAIQRLSVRGMTKNFAEYFDVASPSIVLLPGSFSPYNSKNTLYHYDSFFTLLLPRTVTSRVSDIWRSFIAQRLLWEIDGHISLFPTTSYRELKSRNFVNELHEEEDLYKHSNRLATLLLNWSREKTDIFREYFEVIKELYRNKILGAEDIKLTQAWITDLVRVGYIPPNIKPSSIHCKDSIKFTPKEMMAKTEPNIRFATKFSNYLENPKNTDTTDTKHHISTEDNETGSATKPDKEEVTEPNKSLPTSLINDKMTFESSNGSQATTTSPKIDSTTVPLTKKPKTSTAADLVTENQSREK